MDESVRPEDYVEPYAALERWMASAIASEPQVPDAMQLATVSEDGRPSVRTVLLKRIAPAGLEFFTNYRSRKARELDRTPHAALCLHWKTLERQVVVEGSVGRLEAVASDAYFATRDRGSQLGAWASRQSEPLSTRGQLEEELAAVSRRFEGGEVPRPPHWGGYRLVARRFEFWIGRPSRLHDRVEVVWSGDEWCAGRLYP